KVKYGEPVQLFNGKDLSGWRIIESGAADGWSMKEGALMSNPVQEPGQPHKNYGNLRTDKEFEDFNLTLECNVAKNGNSGIYLRGIYEVQVADTFGKPLDPHNMGAVYSRIKPTESAEKQAGEWQTLDITLVERHVTVVLNGKKITDNQPVLGCTGGALWTDPLLAATALSAVLMLAVLQVLGTLGRSRSAMERRAEAAAPWREDLTETLRCDLTGAGGIRYGPNSILLAGHAALRRTGLAPADEPV